MSTRGSNQAPASHAMPFRIRGVGWCAFTLILVSGACGAGAGTGSITGDVFFLDCRKDENRGTPDNPVAFDLRASFFAGEPIEDIAEGTKVNRLIMRIQRSGTRVEYNDSLFIDISDVYEVARCVRGRRIVQPDGTTVPDFDPDFCLWEGAGPARLRVGMRDYVRASLMPAQTCHRPMVGMAMACFPDDDCENVPPDQWKSWIELERFGNAGQPERAPTERDPVPRNFTVNFGQRIRANHFFLTLEDAQVLQFQTEDFPIGKPRREIGGTLQGNFDFDLERKRSAQTFP